MPGCAAVGCNNRSEKGYIMKCFPRDSKLRKIWQERVGRADWVPSNNSFLCHVHFKPQEWCITQTGRIKLKKDAIPSIFTITSTRKSPKKRRKAIDLQDMNGSKSLCRPESEDNDVVYSTTGTDIGDRPHSMSSVDKDSTEFTSHCRRNTRDMSDCAKTSNENASRANGMQLDGQDANDSKSADVYDEIEEKLKLICHGAFLDGTEHNGEDKIKKESIEKSGTCRNTINEIGQYLVDDSRNVEIIFGAESEDENPSNNVISEMVESRRNLPVEESIGEDRTRRKVFNRYVRQTLGIRAAHVLPNIKAAMKRKRRTRKEIMKSLKRSFGSSGTDAGTNDSNNDTKDLVDRKVSNVSGDGTNEKHEGGLFTIKITGDPMEVADIVQELATQRDIHSDSRRIKIRTCDNDEAGSLTVTSVITVQDQLMRLGAEASRNSTTERIESANDQSDDEDEERDNVNGNRGHGGNDEDDDDEDDDDDDDDDDDEDDDEDEDDDDDDDDEEEDEDDEDDDDEEQDDDTREDDEEDNGDLKLNLNKRGIWTFSHATRRMLEKIACAKNTSKHSSKVEHGMQNETLEELRRRVDAQEEVIGKLTEQLIAYKNMEDDLTKKDTVLRTKTREMETLMEKLERKSRTGQNVYAGGIGVGKRALESKQRLIEDLSNRINFIEEINKKLMKTVTLESQQKRKLEGQLKQKNERIKECNWKLEKASKFLERAERNANTYRKKMLNMQTVMRRKKILDEKMTEFKKLMLAIDDSAMGEEPSESVLNTTLEIRDCCGRDGYEKLICCGFPLPPLAVLEEKVRRLCEEKLVNRTKIDDTVVADASRVKEEPMDDQTDSKRWQEKTLVENERVTETVTGTVQDIFNENNDGDFNTHELREHFILQLNQLNAVI